MRAAKIDRNQPEIVAALRAAGFRVDLTHRIGSGFPDIVVTGYSLIHNITLALLVEIKSGGGRLTGDEKVFHDEYPKDGPLIVAHSERDVLDWFGR